MKSPEEIAQSILGDIAHVYSRPIMHAQTCGELDGKLSILHGIWAFIVERRQEFWRVAKPIHHPTSPSTPPDGFNDVVNDDSEFEAVLRHWKAIDKSLGIILPDG